jgi:hypothetical protein
MILTRRIEQLKQLVFSLKPVNLADITHQKFMMLLHCNQHSNAFHIEKVRNLPDWQSRNHLFSFIMIMSLSV